MAHLSEAAVVKINEICDRYIGEKTPLIMILSDIQKEYGYIPLEVQEIVSQSGKAFFGFRKWLPNPGEHFLRVGSRSQPGRTLPTLRKRGFQLSKVFIHPFFGMRMR
jgi:hypothetical protein